MKFHHLPGIFCGFASVACGLLEIERLDNTLLSWHLPTRTLTFTRVELMDLSHEEFIEAARRIRATQDDISIDVINQLAKDVLEIAMAGGMPESFWHTDSRIKRACKVLDYSPAQAYVWAQHPDEL